MHRLREADRFSRALRIPQNVCVLFSSAFQKGLNVALFGRKKRLVDYASCAG